MLNCHVYSFKYFKYAMIKQLNIFRLEYVLNCHVYLNRVGSEEFRSAMNYILKAVSDHKQTLVKAEPQFNTCNLAIQVGMETYIVDI